MFYPLKRSNVSCIVRNSDSPTHPLVIVAPNSGPAPFTSVLVMLKSAAPSRLAATLDNQVQCSKRENAVQSLPSQHANCLRHFEVLVGKRSLRKRKHWQYDAVLCLHADSTAVVSITAPNFQRIIRRRLHKIELCPGQQLSMDDMEVEVVQEKFLNSNPTVPDGSSSPLSTTTVSDNALKEVVYKVPPFDGPSPSYAKKIEWSEEISLDACWSKVLRPHQLEGVRFLYKCISGLNDLGQQGAVLADEMGLGKSVQCAALILTLMKRVGTQPLVNRVLLLAPCSLLTNWKNEISKWTKVDKCSQAQVLLLQSRRDIDANRLRRPNSILLASYEMFIRHERLFKQCTIDLLICDEAHRLKNAFAKCSTLLYQLSVDKRILLTGTPVQNNLLELYSLCDFANPSVLGSPDEFRSIYVKPILDSVAVDADESDKCYGRLKRKRLNEQLSKFLLRRTQETIAAYLPKKGYKRFTCTVDSVPSALQVGVYRKILRLAKMLIEGKMISPRPEWHLTILDCMRKLCNHPAILFSSCKDCVEKSADESSLSPAALQQCILDEFAETYNVDETRVEDGGKLFVLANLLRNVQRNYPDEKVVIASNFTETLNVIQSYCVSVGYSLYRLDGSTNPAARQKMVDKFNSENDRTFLFLLSTKAGGLGLNLIGANRLILYDLDWNPTCDKQAMARVWRDGQRRVCHIYRLIVTLICKEL
ncbi:protein, SNF2 family [Trichuris suis]|nr:protein, SNF2 family [Trichuris suis]